MRSTRSTLALTAVVAVGLLIIVGSIVLFVSGISLPESAARKTQASESATTTPTGPGKPSPTQSSIPSSTSPPTTRRAWQTNEPASTSNATGSPATSSSSPGGLSRQGMTAEELVTTAARTMTTWDTTTDQSPTDAYRRALPLFVQEYENIFVVPTKPVLPPDWWAAAEHDATSTPRVQITDTYPHGEATLYYVVVHWSWEADNDFELNAGPKYMTFQVSQDDTGFVIENWTEEQLQ
ncbi:hypothetical protein ACFFIO_07780 [Citricoccus parietis]|uniref:Uncharacterized protein n=2 Tax=Citricoccus parietis TaxID=592307 RepID=A0ABV6F4G1_9MICC